MINGHRRVAEVARELDLNENLLHRRVRDERRRMTVAGSGSRPGPVGGEHLSLDEPSDLVRLRALVAEQSKDIALLKKASAYFAAQQPR